MRQYFDKKTYSRLWNLSCAPFLQFKNRVRFECNKFDSQYFTYIFFFLYNKQDTCIKINSFEQKTWLYPTEWVCLHLKDHLMHS